MNSVMGRNILNIKIEKGIQFWFDKILNTILLIISIVTVLLTYSTLKEMQYQRSKSFEPDLMIKETYVRYKGDTSGDIHNQIFEGIDTLHAVEASQYNICGNRLELKNIGMGTAKQVIFVWELYPIHNYIDLIEELDTDNLFNISLSSEPFCIDIEYGDEFARYYFDDEFEVVDYLVPVYTEDTECSIYYPYYYIYMNSMLLSLYARHYDTLPTIQLPVIEGALMYYDIQGNSISKGIRLYSTIELYKCDQDGNYEAIIEIRQSIPSSLDT